MRIGLRIGLLLAFAAGAWATTLEQLSMASMIRQSTAIVRARVTGSSAARRGSNIYTFYRLDVLETLKASGAPPSEVAVPGGAVSGIRQTVAGAPKLSDGQEYVLFLWTSPSGLTQAIGLTQGVFTVLKNAGGEATVVRAASTEPMLGPGGQPVKDQSVSLTLEALRQTILQQISTGGAK
jgi:hypothetical protein